ncbi:MAG: hypothetical protein U0174_25755 [Polyangiaceae bacterium]
MNDKQRGLFQATIAAGVALGVSSLTGCFSKYCCPISDGETVPPAARTPRQIERAVVCDLEAGLFEGDAGHSGGEQTNLSVSPDGSHLYVHQPSATYRFDVRVDTKCVLTLDKTFGDAGVLNSPTERIFETENGVFVSDATGLHVLGSKSACVLPEILAATDRGERVFALASPANADKGVISVDPRACPSELTSSTGKLTGNVHVAAGVGDSVVHFATGGEKPLIETYDPLFEKVVRTARLTTNTPYPNTPPSLAVEVIRGCGKDDLCVATGPSRALNRFGKEGTIILRQPLDSLDYLPEAVRKGVGQGRAALTRDGRAFYAYIADGKLGVLRVSVNYVPLGDAGVNPGVDASSDAGQDGSTDASSPIDASDAGTD